MITKEDISKDYAIAHEAAEILNVNDSRIRQLCITGRFSGAFKIGETWFIPREAIKKHQPLKRGVKSKGSSNKVILDKAIKTANNLKEAILS